jgi:hypothetical protein
MMKKIPIPKNESGQVLVIVAVSFVVLLLFVGLAIDGAQLTGRGCGRSGRRQ